MDRPDDIVEIAQHRVRVVEAAVCQYVGFHALEEAERAPAVSREPFIQGIDCRTLSANLVDRKSTGIAGAARVIGDSQITPTERASRLGHLVERRLTVRVGGVTVEGAL